MSSRDRVGNSGAVTLSPEAAKRYYDRFGSKQDSQAFYEDPAVQRLVGLAEFERASAVFEFGCGTGRFAAELLQHHLHLDCRYRGIDISSEMIRLSRERLKTWQPRARVDESGVEGLEREPVDGYDRFVSNYVFDLLSEDTADRVMRQAHRMLRAEGRLCVVSLTNGVGIIPKIISWGWTSAFRLRPSLVGGCRPIELANSMNSPDWKILHNERRSAFGITSEILVAQPIKHPSAA